MAYDPNEESAAEPQAEQSAHPDSPDPEIVVVAPRILRPSPDCYAIIKHFEVKDGQPILRAYLPTPDDVPTIGYGTTRGIKLGMTCTPQQAQQWLEDDVWSFASFINNQLDRTEHHTTQHQFDALVSWAYNVGHHPNSGLLRCHLLGQHRAAEAQFHRWVYQKGKVLRGLVRRRTAEAALYATPEGYPAPSLVGV